MFKHAVKQLSNYRQNGYIRCFIEDSPSFCRVGDNMKMCKYCNYRIMMHIDIHGRDPDMQNVW